MALLGRQAEQEVLSRLLASARLGRGGALAVVGEPGVGKTALIADALDGSPGTGGADGSGRADGSAGLQRLSATGTEAEQDLPFAALHAVLLPALPLLGTLPGPQADALGAALSLRPGGGRGGDRFAIGAATLSLLNRYAESGPTLVVLDDAQWMDLPSVEAIAFAARRLVDDPVAVLAAARSGGLPVPLRSLPVLELEGLGPEAAALLVTGEFPELVGQEVHERLYRMTAGNPLGLLELARDPGTADDAAGRLPPTLPARLQAAYARRLDPLTDEERAVALVAAVAGDDLRLVTATCAALDLDVAAPDALTRAGVLRPGVMAGRVTFHHPLLRSAVYGASTRERRRRVHLAVADQLTDPADADRRVWHLAAGVDRLDEGVAAQLEEVAARAGARTASSVESTALERAARLSPEPGAARTRLVAAARAAWAGGQQDRSLALLDEAERDGAAPTPAGTRVRAAVAVRSGSLREGLALLEQAAAQAPAGEAVPLLADACHACVYLVDTASLRRVRGRLTELLPQTVEPHARAVGTAACGVADVLLGQDGSDLLREALPLLARHADPLTQPGSVPWLGLVPLFLRDAEAGAELRELVQDVRARLGLGALPNLLFHVARDQATSTRWGRAAANYAEAVSLALETGQGAELAMSLAGLAALDSRAGRAEDCREHAHEALEVCRGRSLHFAEIWCELALGDLALSEGDAAAAAERFGALDRRLDALDVGDPDLRPGPDLVDALIRVGRAEEARAAAARFADLASATGRPWSSARADRALALVADEDDVDALCASALGHHGRTRDVFETARTRLAHGMRLRRAGRRVDARPVLRDALRVLDDLGALTWAESARTELAATGERVAPHEPLGPASLTHQELQVCVLLAEGRTTREAAAALFLSPKTVEYHLRKAYTKLDVHSRADLVLVMSTLDDQAP